MRLTKIFAFSLLVACSASKEVKQTILNDASSVPAEIQVNQADVAKDIRYLASDELGGRGTGSKGIEMAATYISEVFAEAKVSTVPGMKQYTQRVPLVEQSAPVAASFKVADKNFVLGEDLVVLRQAAVDQTASLRFFGDISPAELAKEDLKGAIIVTMAGSKSEGDPRVFYQLALEKQKVIAANGGVALIELYRSPRAPFSQVARFFGRGGISIDESSGRTIPVIWLNDSDGANLQIMDESAGTAAKLSIKPGMRKEIPAKNVLGFLPGTNPLYNKEIILVSAHYDHLGIDGSRGGVDSIFNGARDNAMGTAAMLGVVRHFGAHPGKRPILFAAWTAEEKGLLGSEYYAQSPVVPLNEIAFNLNLDGAGYDDTTSVTMNGYDRTTAQASIDAAIASVGLTPSPDPVPEMGLFQQSDNWSFAKRGVPALNIAPGYTGFTPELMKYYHQAGDHIDQLDFAYVTRYVEAAVASAQVLVNQEATLSWSAGDEFAPPAKNPMKN